MAPVRGGKMVSEVSPCLSQQNGACRARAGRARGGNAAPAGERAPGQGGEARRRRRQQSAAGPRAGHRTGLLGVPRPPSVLAVSSHLKRK